MVLAPAQEIDLRSQLDRILGKTITDDQFNVLKREIEVNTQDPLPEQLFTCSKCGKTIKAYGPQGEAFITEYGVSGPIYYHNDLTICNA